MAENRALTLAGLASADPADSGLDVVEDPAPRHPAQHTKPLGQRIEQHLPGHFSVAISTYASAARYELDPE